MGISVFVGMDERSGLQVVLNSSCCHSLFPPSLRASFWKLKLKVTLFPKKVAKEN